MNHVKNILLNTCIALNSLLVVLILFDESVVVPALLQVVGRMHPLMLHFPIVLIVLVIFWEVALPKTSISDKEVVGDWLLLLAAVFAAATAIGGFLLSKENGYESDTIELHKWTGFAVSLIALLWYLLRTEIRNKWWSTLIVGLATLVMITLTGHEGANITHGDNFILEPITNASAKTVLIDDAYTYEHVVKPIFEQKCFSCHSSKKAKGKLVMESIEKLQKGGENGVLWDTLDSELGLMMHHLNLPIEEETHMPPKGKPQLTESEKLIIYHWIKSGSSFHQKVLDLSATDTLRLLAASQLETIESDVYSFEAADEDVIKELNTAYRVVRPLALKSPALFAEFFGQSFFSTKQLEELNKVGNQIVSLSLNGMPVQDEDLKIIAQFQNLRKLDLSGTAITGATLSELKVLKELRQLSLTRTKLSIEELKWVGGLKNLSALFVWNTELTSNDVKKLRQQFPTLLIENGFTGEEVITRLSPPIIEDTDQIFEHQKIIRLKHTIKGAVIRYTIDGSNPDSIHSAIYANSGIEIKEPLELKAQAYLKGWISSDVISQSFYRKGIQPDSLILAEGPNPDYRGMGAQTLFDGRKGTTNFRTPQWLGFRENPMVLLVLFDKPTELASITLSCLIDINSYIFPGTQFQIMGDDGNGNQSMLATLIPKEPKQIESAYLKSFLIKFPKTTVHGIKIIVKPVKKLPNWHPGKGDKGWIFIDEIFLN